MTPTRRPRNFSGAASTAANDTTPEGSTTSFIRSQTSRIAAMKAADAGFEVRGAAMASDAFFPFRDGLDVVAAAGVTAVVQPGGSVRDDEVIAAADQHGLAMVFTGERHFRH